MCCRWAQAEADLQRKHAEMMGRMRGVGMLKAAEKPSKQADDGSKDQADAPPDGQPTGALPDTPPAATTTPSVVWEYEDGRVGGGKFRPLSLETQRMLESAVLSGHDEAMFKVKKASYTVDLKTMMQTNTFSGKSRALRRREGGPAPAAGRGGKARRGGRRGRGRGRNAELKEEVMLSAQEPASTAATAEQAAEDEKLRSERQAQLEMDWAASVAGQGLGHGQKKSKLRVSSPVRPKQPTSQRRFISSSSLWTSRADVDACCLCRCRAR